MSKSIENPTLELALHALMSYRTVIISLMQDAGITGSRAKRVTNDMQLVIDEANELSLLARRLPQVSGPTIGAAESKAMITNSECGRRIEEFWKLVDSLIYLAKDIASSRFNAWRAIENLELLNSDAMMARNKETCAVSLDSHVNVFASIAESIKLQLVASLICATAAALQESENTKL